MGAGIELEKQFEAVGKLSEVHGDLKQLIVDMPPSGYKTRLIQMVGAVAAAQDLIAPEQVTAEASPPESGAPSIGWLGMGGLSVSLTRSMLDGKLVVTIENTVNDASDELELPVRVELLSGEPVWEGVVH